MLRISQVAKMLNMSSDSLKFYEDKNLLFPKRNEDNGYREYNTLDIMDILTINFYRSIDFEIKKIQELRKDKSIDDLYALLIQQEKNIEDEIKLKKKMLKRIQNTVSGYKRIKEYLDVFSIREFEPVVVKYDASNILHFDKGQSNANQESFFSWNNLIRFSHFDEAGILDTKLLIVEDAKTNENNNLNQKSETLHFPKCIYTVVEAGGNDNIDTEIGEKIKKAAVDMKVDLLGIAIVRNLIVVYEDKIDKIYSEIFIPIK